MKTIDSDCKNKFKWAWLERRVDLEIGKKKGYNLLSRLDKKSGYLWKGIMY